MKIPLLLRIVIAIIAGTVLGIFLPLSIVRIFATFNGIFNNFLGFIIPLIILGFVTPAIGELGKGAGKLLAITVLLAYGSTIFSGFFTYFSCDLIFPSIISGNIDLTGVNETNKTVIEPYFKLSIPAPLDVMTALVLSFCLGIGISVIKGSAMQKVFTDFSDTIALVVEAVIIPLLPLYIFGMFLGISFTGEVYAVLSLFMKVILVVFFLHISLLLIQFIVAGSIVGKNPLALLRNMMPAYVTALGTSSSAATIPVTLKQTLKNGVSHSIASFTVPLCATIHLAGSTMKITAFAMAVMSFSSMPFDISLFAGFILMLGVMMVAAPGVPGGGIMAAIGILQSMLGFDEQMCGLMILLYVAVDSFGTACNVTGDGAISLIVDKIYKGQKKVVQ